MKIALKDQEHIRETYRQSPFVLIHPMLISALAIIITVYGAFRYGGVTGTLRTAIIIWIIVVLAHAIRILIIWRMNTYVVTNQRLLHYAQKGLFDQTVTETPHERILNVSYKTEGLISRFMGYGDVVVQVVGLMEPIILKNIDTPMEIKDYLWEMHKRISSDKAGTVFAESDATHIQERVGYTKRNKTEL